MYLFRLSERNQHSIATVEFCEESPTSSSSESISIVLWKARARVELVHATDFVVLLDYLYKLYTVLSPVTYHNFRQ